MVRIERVPDAEEEPEGTLWCSGLIAGASILGILAALQSFLPGYDTDIYLVPAVAFLRDLPFGAVGGASSPLSDVFGLGMLVLLGYLMLRGARPPGSRPPGSPPPGAPTPPA